MRKKTVLWTVFADVVKEQSDAKAHGSVPKKSLTLRQSKKAGFIEQVRKKWTIEKRALLM